MRNLTLVLAATILTISCRTTSSQAHLKDSDDVGSSSQGDEVDLEMQCKGIDRKGGPALVGINKKERAVYFGSEIERPDSGELAAVYIFKLKITEWKQPRGVGALVVKGTISPQMGPVHLTLLGLNPEGKVHGELILMKQDKSGPEDTIQLTCEDIDPV
jgi:hypothetical protein